MTVRDIRERITKLRLERNLSEMKMSLELGHSESYINHIASGRASPSLQGILNICEYLEIEPSELFEDPVPRPVERVLRKVMADLTDEDLEHLLYIAKQLAELRSTKQ